MPFLAIAIKDLKLLLRDKSAAFFTFLFPLMLALFFGSIFPSGGGNSSPMEIVVVNEDGGTASLSFLADLSKADGLNVSTLMSRAEAEAAVRKGQVNAAVIIPKGFQEQSQNIFSGKAMKIEGLVDPSHRAESGLITGKLNEIAFQQLSKSFTDTSRMNDLIKTGRDSIQSTASLSPERRKLFGGMFDSLDEVLKYQDQLRAEQDAKESAESGGVVADSKDAKKRSVGGGEGFAFKPVDVTVTEVARPDNRPQSAFEISFPQGVVWGLMGCVVTFGVSLASERAQGTLRRLTVSPLSHSQILLGKALGCFLACLLVQVMLVLFSQVVGVHIRSPLMMFVAVLSASVGFTGVMMVLAGFARSEEAAGGIGRAVMIILAMIGGGTLPLAFMPPFMQTASSVSPFKWATVAIEGAVWRGFGPADMLLPCGILLAMGVVGYATGSRAFRWAEAK